MTRTTAALAGQTALLALAIPAVLILQLAMLAAIFVISFDLADTLVTHLVTSWTSLPWPGEGLIQP